MTWEDVFKVSTAVLTSLGGGAALIFACSSWLGKVWAARILEKEKHELEKLRIEHETRFSKLHLERAEAIKEVCELLGKLDDSIHSFLKEFQPIEEDDLETKIQTSIEYHNKFVELYKKHRIYFSPSLVELMQTMAICSRDTFVDVQTYPLDVADVEYQMMPELLKERDECWKNAREKYLNELSRLIAQLEQNFREILGIK